MSCRESKTMNPKLLAPSNKDQPRQEPSRRSRAFRSTSLLPKPNSPSSDSSMPRSRVGVQLVFTCVRTTTLISTYR